MTKKKVGFMVAALCLISVVMIVCSKNTADTLNLSSLQRESGEYVYPGVEWLMSINELEENLGYTFDNPEFGSEQEPFDYRTNTNYEFAIFSPKEQDKYVKLFDNYGQISYQLELGELKSVQLTFKNNVDKMKNNKLEDLATKTRDELIKLYGENFILKDSSADDKSPIDVITYTWEHIADDNSVTRIFLSVIPSTENTNTVSLGVSYFINKN
ncbi:MAG: hypothetical protein IKK03_12735 [Lachnospiraceae bacterium]|nr:hypothetical protein [Lachnospiraceae bacterium]